MPKIVQKWALIYFGSIFDIQKMQFFLGKKTRENGQNRGTQSTFSKIFGAFGAHKSPKKSYPPPGGWG